MLHTLNPDRRTLHGVLADDIEPVLTIASGDLVRLSTLEPDWRVRDTGALATSEGDFFPRIPGYDDGHALIGPIAVKEAKAGQTLAVTIRSLTPESWGWSRVGGEGDSDHAERAQIEGDEYFLRWKIDSGRGMCTSSHGHHAIVRPFLGVMAVAPRGKVRTHIPGPHGGNLDCKELVPSSTIYLPVFADGALFSTGDGHAAQGNGESGGTAVECPMKEAILEFRVLDTPSKAPVAKTPKGWLTFGFHADLTTAAYEALQAMAELISRMEGVSHKEALAIFSVSGDLCITQIVNGVRGVHALLPYSALGPVQYK